MANKETTRASAPVDRVLEASTFAGVGASVGSAVVFLELGVVVVPVVAAGLGADVDAAGADAAGAAAAGAGAAAAGAGAAAAGAGAAAAGAGADAAGAGADAAGAGADAAGAGAGAAAAGAGAGAAAAGAGAGAAAAGAGAGAAAAGAGAGAAAAGAGAGAGALAATMVPLKGVAKYNNVAPFPPHKAWTDIGPAVVGLKVTVLDDSLPLVPTCVHAVPAVPSPTEVTMPSPPATSVVTVKT